MYERILVPLDGSRVAELALDHTAQLARQFGSQLVLVRVVYAREIGLEGPEDQLRIDSMGTEADVRDAEEYLSGVQGKLLSDGIKATTAVMYGDVSQQILSKAADVSARLIVMSTHGHGGLKRSDFGSVAGAVLRQSHVPLLVLPYR
jgi:nucleotide-binding universal stress UspA family protein